MGSNPILSAIKKVTIIGTDSYLLFNLDKDKSAIFWNNDIIFFFQILKNDK